MFSKALLRNPMERPQSSAESADLSLPGAGHDCLENRRVEGKDGQGPEFSHGDVLTGAELMEKTKKAVCCFIFHPAEEAQDKYTSSPL